MVTAVDSSILLDVLLNDAQHSGPSVAALRQASAEGSLIICETVLAEIAPALASTEVPQFLSDSNLKLGTRPEIRGENLAVESSCFISPLHRKTGSLDCAAAAQ